MQRRKFIQFALAVPVATLLGTKVVAMVRHYPLADLLQQLKRYPADKLINHGDWPVSQILQHLAQSVRYSRLGYPEHKSTLFHYTAGSIAFNAFAASGSMHHALNEPIPGAPSLVNKVPNDVALAELIQELEIFIAWQGDLAAHFAYGHLTKQQYYTAHYLHIQDHLKQISLS
ncbi:DUF1569 domain-containing protein [Rheinheimera sp. WS51]|uniref:DUF1569 domain-containing protein n=1 Tax=Rheinheimera sp. WS51 TaxID=3425886 RepID=UPI003D9475CA